MPFAHRAAQAAKLTVQKPQIALGLFHCLISEHLMIYTPVVASVTESFDSLGPRGE
jgi:hypothetical protein